MLGADLLRGAGYLARGMKLIFRPGLRRYAMLPILINSVIFLGLVATAVDLFSQLVETWVPTADGAWWGTVRALLWLIFAIGVGLTTFFTFTIVANLLGAPFNGLLAEAVEIRLRSATAVPGMSLRQVLMEIPRTLRNECRKIAYFLIWALPLLVLFVIPGLNIAAPLVWALFLAWMLAVEYLDYPMGNHRHDLRSVRAWLKTRRSLALGFGATVLGATLLPGINLIVMPAAVAGATALWVDAGVDASTPAKVNSELGVKS
ncbi:MAG: sulfate transporter CysZ [Gammaproteobacteria bacterium]|nr:sulfate transporter CysZ [Gammaproteobacteria bacterium]